mmetsp:Transcript_13/g.30  ORF Transcript_13/g.30 Transcript_13/m.30 type:complete len:345 (-) Transcript_13:143-1177(-)
MASSVGKAVLFGCFLAGAAERYALRPHGDAPARPTHTPHRSRRRLSAAALLWMAAPGRAREAPASTEWLEGFDQDGDGAVSREEFLAAAMPADDDLDDAVKERLANLYERIFAASDITGDGSLNDAEVQFADGLAVVAMNRFAHLLPPPEDSEGQEEGAPNPRDDLGEQRAAHVFATMDLNSDGKVDVEEYMKGIHTVAREMGWGEGDLGDPALVDWSSALLARADVTGDGSLDQKEVQFASILLEDALASESGMWYERSMASNIAKLWAEEYDADGDGRLAGEELEGLRKLATKELESEDDAPFIERFVKHFDAADADGDGAVDLAELEQLARLVVHDAHEDL